MDKSKRNLTKALGVAGAGSVVWDKPVVNTVILPAHAATTDAATTGCDECFPYDGGWAKVVSTDQFYSCDTLTTWEIYIFTELASCQACADASCDEYEGRNFDVVFADSVDAAIADGCECFSGEGVFLEVEPPLPCPGTAYRCFRD